VLWKPGRISGLSDMLWLIDGEARLPSPDFGRKGYVEKKDVKAVRPRSFTK
jgi:hypothetical protein